MKAYERLINYVKIHTASAEDVDMTPTTERQFDLSRFLAEELEKIGVSNVYMDDHAYVYGELPATLGLEDRPCVAFIAHLDTIPDFSGENVKPQVIENYDGGDVVLGESGRVLSVEKYSHLPSLKGQTLITTDGTTVLGADDKAGIAEIVTACERLINGMLPHGRIAVCFTPDEEVGHGASLLDIGRTGADFAFTLDGGEVEELNYETFNAAGARVDFNGFNIHPGSAKDMMINASLVAMEFNSLLPAGDVPSKTEDYEGFYHLTDMSGSVEKASLSYIIRDHDKAAFECRKALMRHAVKVINEKYGDGTAELTIREQYSNMAEYVMTRPEIVELAKRAIRREGLEPAIIPIRGGTDGAQLSRRGLLCPNLGTGGYSFHGPYEHITAERMETMVNIILNVIDENIK